MSAAPPAPTRSSIPAGILFAVASCGIWGFLPLLFYALSKSSPVEIVSWRVVLALVFCALVLTVVRGWGRFAAVVRDRRLLLTVTAGAVVLLFNWLVFIFATTIGQVVEAALGYFTTPIVTVLPGVVVLRERLRPLQWVAIGVSVVAVVVLAIGYGSFPWLALVLAFSFAGYGLIKNRVGHRVDALAGLTVESAVLTPVAIVALVVLGATTGLTLGQSDPVHTILLLSVGVATAVPLILFASAARRLPLVYLGLAQYLTPILQFIIGVAILHEAMPAPRWIGFAIVWLALIILTVDILTNAARQRAAAVSTTA